MRQQQNTHATTHHSSQMTARKGIVVPVAAAVTFGLAAGVALGTAFFVSGEHSHSPAARAADQAVESALAPNQTTSEARTGRAIAPDPASTIVSAAVPAASVPADQLPVQAPVAMAALTAGNQDDAASTVEPTVPPPAQLAARFGDALPGVDAAVVARPDDTIDALPIDALPQAGSAQTAPALNGVETAAVSAAEPAPPTAPQPINDDGPVVEIAQSEEEVLAIEERLAAAGAAYFQLPQDTTAPFDAALSGGSELPPAQTNAWVNLRAGPDNDAQIVMVVPAGADIGAEQGCPHWCAVVYDGQRGYIYQSFIRR